MTQKMTIQQWAARCTLYRITHAGKRLGEVAAIDEHAAITQARKDFFEDDNKFLDAMHDGGVRAEPYAHWEYQDRA
ncbi:MAG: hypothetical protein IT464_12790 [Planctomycetes bacterium]|nr:hypothetical protein [Planctomycetota bacterium]